MISKDQLRYEAVPLPHRARMDDEQMLLSAEAFHDQMRRRHSVRNYSDRPVPRAVIESCLRTAGTAPSGANHQPWHFAAIADPALKQQIRAEAEAEERRFYAGGGGDEWIRALEPIGTTAEKPHLTRAPWLIVVFAQRWGRFEDGSRYKNYYVPESVNIATGILLAALHHAGLAALTHTPNPMKFLNAALNRPEAEKPTMIIALGHPAADATVPAAAKIKKPLEEIASFFD
ncbi:nitroreductase family protein [Pseudodonghicola flavimaris]|uniref:Nitroreductase family protein n=1 Tax=Pseudodonghicola flavimaris TaxID=3050036 RepID=A0ABT7F0K3_9RHOB|nr:nitroreductase family protein [Pseudodonghicola flavimaris]MDK3018122.1 nitroreductase family protein [Pseudodonghicola flavimaris]